jgi:hypothetical protein
MAGTLFSGPIRYLKYSQELMDWGFGVWEERKLRMQITVVLYYVDEILIPHAASQSRRRTL